MTAVQLQRWSAGHDDDAQARNISAHFGGAVSGQVVFGEGNVLIDESPGAVVRVYRGTPPNPRPRPRPVRLPPRDFPTLLGRSAESSRASTALSCGQPVEVTANPGWGKTALLRHLANHLPGSVPPDGVVGLDGRDLPVDDLLQIAFDVFYETDVPYKPGRGELQHLLSTVRALVVVDDLGIPREQLSELLDVLAGCAFLSASEERTLWGEGEAIHLAGLDDESGVALFERELGRRLADEERDAARQVCRALECQPLRIIQAATLAREQDVSVRGLAAAHPAGPAPAGPLVAGLQPVERDVLGLLATGLPLSTGWVARITGRPGAARTVESLAGRGLAHAVGGGYLAADTAQQAIPRPEIEASARAAVASLAAWVRSSQPAAVLEEAPVLMEAARIGSALGLWNDVRSLVRALSHALALSGRWSAWGDALEVGLHAAERLMDTGERAWCLHQLGTLALCQGDVARATSLLQEALGLRRAIGDREGQAVTRQNLARVGVRAHVPWKLIGVGGAAALVVAGAVTGALMLLKQPTLELQPGRLDFGGVPVAEQKTIDIVLTARNAPLGVSSMSTEGDFQQTNDCPQHLPADGHCTIHVSFQPSQAGSRQGNLVVTDSSGTRQTAGLTGTGTTGALAFEPASLDFGEQPVGGAGASLVLHVTNRGGAPVRVTSVTASGDFSVGPGCMSDLAAGQSCDVPIRFVPGAAGSRLGRISIVANGMEYSADLRGAGTSPSGTAKILFEPAALDFGKQSVKISATHTVTIHNAGSAPLEQPGVNAGGDFQGSASGCDAQALSPGSSCPIVVTFTPSTIGARTGTLIVTGSHGERFELALSGKGLAPLQPKISPSPIDFGAASGSTKVTVTNAGGAILAVTAVVVSGDPAFHLDRDGCSNTLLQPGEACSLWVRFQPTTGPSPPSTGPDQDYTGWLRLTDNAAPTGQQTVVLRGTVVG